MKVLLALIPFLCWAGPIDVSAVSISPIGNTSAATSWTQLGGYSNVTITVDLFGGPNGGTFFLMNQIGPGTTAANQIAQAEVTGFVGNAEVVAFTGLTLGPGTYYLVFQRNVNGPQWLLDPSPAITLDPGVTLGSFYGGGSAAYAPAANFVALNGLYGLYSVQGTAVPEPGGAILMSLGLLVLWRRRKRETLP